MPVQLPIRPDQPVGLQLKDRRQAMKLSLAQVELDTKIRGKFLTALEACDYDKLPNDIYSRGFVQHYANHLGMDGQLVAAAYSAERGGLDEAKAGRPQLARGRRLVFTGPIVGVLAGLVVAATVVAYLAWQFSALAAPPRLDLSSPVTDETLTGASLTVAGTTTPGSDVTINDSSVVTDTDGGFSERVTLRDGLNQLKITAVSKLGKTTTITRTIRARVPAAATGAVSVPTVLIDGVAILVSTKRSTSMVVTADGKEVFRGTVLAGTSTLYGGVGTATVSLTTGDAGATSVTVTNAIAAGKRLESLGRDGEIRRDQAFAKDTVIP